MTIYGSETPRLWTPPLRELTPDTSAGFSAIAFAEDILGLTLLPWQKWLLIHMMELRPDGRFRFRTVLILVARQNGKTVVSQVYALWRLYVEQAREILVTAQSLDKAEDIWQNSVDLAESVPMLAAEFDGDPVMAAGKKALKLTQKRRYKVEAANRKAGRSLSADGILLDELREHKTWDAWAALKPTTNARPNGQIVLTSNMGDDASVVLNAQREIGLTTLDGDGPADFGMFEWSPPDHFDYDDRAAWAQANPSMNYLIDEEVIRSSRHSDPEGVFLAEVMCRKAEKLTADFMPAWPACHDPATTMAPGLPVAFGVDVSWDRSTAWIAAAAQRKDGQIHIELVDTRPGTEWVTDRVAELVAKWSPLGVFYQGNGAPVSSIGLDFNPLGASDLAKASGAFFDAVAQKRVAHTGQEPLADAATHATIRAFGDAWLIDRKKSPVDVAPMNAALQAAWGLATTPPPKPKRAPRRLR